MKTFQSPKSTMYLAQAQILLPKVGTDDFPGDGGPDKGKLTRPEVIALYITIAEIQKKLGKSAESKAAFAKAESILVIPKLKEPSYVGLDNLIDAYLRNGLVTEAFNLYKTYDSNGYHANKIAEKQDVSSAKETLSLAIAKVESHLKSIKPDDTAELATARQDDADVLLSALKEARRRPETNALAEEARAKLLALMALLPSDEMVTAMLLCACVKEKLGNDPTTAEAMIRKTAAERVGVLGQSLIWLGKTAEGKALLLKTKKAQDIPRRIWRDVTPEDLIAIATKHGEGYLLTQEVGFMGNTSPQIQQKLLLAADKLDKGCVESDEWIRVGKMLDAAGRKLFFALALKQVNDEVKSAIDYQKSRPMPPDSFEASSREAGWAVIVAQLAAIEMPGALKYLPKVQEPRYRLKVLLAIAKESL
jgi:hypothetical protein